DDNTLTVNVNRLRKKLENAGLKDCISTIRGQGYQFQVNRKDEPEC
ncbi:winged helix-turn-helix domain-containing protein, partial [Bacillus spizizenii]|nr:winged helix-turn-helix domain-containing protein [Bacillus spizizenii]